ncbi:unnamed protein product, partial [Polarella glacialis]
VVNADKGAIDVDELIRRIQGVVARGYRVLATRASLFDAKAALCPGCDFAVGYDTYRRILDAKYAAPAGQSLESSTAEERRSWVLEALRRLKCHRVHFVVAGRVDGDGFKTMDTDPVMELPEEFEGMFLPVPNFRLDISSSALRAQSS